MSLKEGARGSSQGVSLLTKAAHPNATKVFINWLFSEEGAAIYAKARGGMSIRKGVPNYSPEAAKVNLDIGKIYMETVADRDVANDNYGRGVKSKILQEKK